MLMLNLQCQVAMAPSFLSMSSFSLPVCLSVWLTEWMNDWSAPNERTQLNWTFLCPSFTLHGPDTGAIDHRFVCSHCALGPLFCPLRIIQWENSSFHPLPLPHFPVFSCLSFTRLLFALPQLPTLPLQLIIDARCALWVLMVPVMPLLFVLFRVYDTRSVLVKYSEHSHQWQCRWNFHFHSFSFSAYFANDALNWKRRVNTA